MRLKKGDMVEVTNRKENPDSWRVAEILSGNGHTYHLKYVSYPGMSNEKKVETVSRMNVRPCPPVVQRVEDFLAGETVEVFYEHTWKTAAILNVLQGRRETPSKKSSLQKRYLVRLLGSSEEIIVNGTNIRKKQTWQDNKWILFENSSRGGEVVTGSKPSTSMCHQNVNFKITLPNTRAKKTPQRKCINSLDETRFVESHHDSRSLKRMSPYESSINEAHHQKLRVIEQGKKKQIVAAVPVFENSDAFSYIRDNLGERNTHASVRTIATEYNQRVRVKVNDGPRIRNYQSSSLDSDACSVGSCSVTDQSPNHLDMPSTYLDSRETDAVSSDADSGYDSAFERKSNSLPPEEEVEISIRRLELHAYRRTLEALYASGPLSWEQESMLTNLRIMLHISNDEHLTELKHLISTKTGQVGGNRFELMLPRLKADAVIRTDATENHWYHAISLSYCLFVLVFFFFSPRIHCSRLCILCLGTKLAESEEVRGNFIHVKVACWRIRLPIVGVLLCFTSQFLVGNSKNVQRMYRSIINKAPCLCMGAVNCLI